MSGSRASTCFGHRAVSAFGIILGLSLATLAAQVPPDPRQSVELRPGCKLYADKIEFTNAAKTMGKATGHVFVDLTPGQDPPETRQGWADSATFDVGKCVVELRGWPHVIRGHHLHRAIDGGTFMKMTWVGKYDKIESFGPAKTEIIE